ncbi:unnamed protein product [Fusarium graminearum]|nr:unnamed protein product [Fusarium graminearum]
MRMTIIVQTVNSLRSSIYDTQTIPLKSKITTPPSVYNLIFPLLIELVDEPVLSISVLLPPART